LKKTLLFTLQSIINSYAILFFSQNKVFGILLLIASFLNPVTGIAGFISVVFSIGLVTLMGYHRESIRMGFYSFNALLLGIGFGTFYQLNIYFFIWLIIACTVVTMLSIALSAKLIKYNLPLLSLPFILIFWLVMLGANSLYYMGLAPLTYSTFVFDIYADGTNSFSNLLPFTIPVYLGFFFRSISAILFQNNVLAGIIISVGLIIHSRIYFSLMVIAFITACLLNYFLGTYPDGISYYNLGANVMMASAALGSFFLIPSTRSYLWAIVIVPLMFLFINGLARVSVIFDLPVLSLPFCLLIYLLIYFLRLRINPGKLQLTPIQYYSPERNLYQHLNTKERLNDLYYFNFSLPFMGTWLVSQGYNGTITHKGDWGNALDFVIKDDDNNTFKYPGLQLSDFYCYNKPVLACGDGIIEHAVSHIEDNEINQINTVENWGNTIVIKHLNGLYSKISHLKKDSVKVKPGDYVKRGDIIAMCGSSGRSPEPHLHFQIQTTPYIGSKTITYPLSYYINQTDTQNKLTSFTVPDEDTLISPVVINSSLKKAFNLLPGYTANLSANDRATEPIEVFMNELNQTYIYCKTTGSAAYFIDNGTSFYFTDFYGDRDSLLYFFFLAAYRVVFTVDPSIKINDVYPIQIATGTATLWLQDIIAPFFQFITLRYENSCVADGQHIVINANQYKKVFNSKFNTMNAQITINGNELAGFRVNFNGKKVEVQWINGDIY
jgi:urea transporter/murein DD-endopeptidase MepM/ murein hydrolase activator NlpD